MLKQSLTLFKRAFNECKTAKINLILVLILEALSITGLYFLNKQYGLIYQGIQDYNIPMIWKGVGLFSAIAGLLVVVGGVLTYYTNKLAFDIRTGLTVYYFNQFLKLHSYQNIEQRIQEDLKNFGERSCEFWLAVLRSAVKLPIFMGVIITLTQWWVGVVILIAVVLGTLATKLLAKKVIELQAEQETNEANFRLEIPKNRRFAMMIFDQITTMFNAINKQVKKLSFLQYGLGQTFVLLPFIILLPLYISKAVTMGGFMQSVNALSKVIDSLTVLIDNRMMIVNISTCLKRLEKLDESH